jgi:hypothetical protein
MYFSAGYKNILEPGEYLRVAVRFGGLCSLHLGAAGHDQNI